MKVEIAALWRMSSGLAALVAILTLAAPNQVLGFKVGYHERLTEQQLRIRGFDVDSADEVGDSNYYTDYAEPQNDAAHADNNMLDAASARLDSKRIEIGDALSRCERRAALDRLGEALHTVQDIYSHSNSVDNGIAVGNLFGLERGDAPCALPNFAPGGLVTGYFSLPGFLAGLRAPGLFSQCTGIGLKKPKMCCHRDLNKDDPGENNGGKHAAALAAAGAGTNTFMDHLEQDIRARFGELNATQMIKLLERKQRTVYFVIDDTGSMGSDIAAVKSTANAFLDQIIAGDEAPTLGLASFKDSVNDRGISCDIEALRSQVNSLFASGGNDCPEASNSGLLTALSHFPTLGTDMQLRGGRVLLATDASAGDSSLGPKVAVQAAIKGVSIDAILTGDCVEEEDVTLGFGEELEFGEDGQNRSVDLHLQQPESLALAEAIDPLTSQSARTQLRALTETTGGVLFNVSRFEVDEVIPTLLELSRPDVAVLFTRRAILASGIPFIATVPIDETLDESVTFMVTASTAGNLPSLALQRPDGTLVVAGDPGVIIRDLSSVRTTTIQTPSVGTWKAVIAGAGTFNLRVFGATAFQLNSVRLQKDAPEFLRPEVELAPLTGQPFVGDTVVADFRYTEAPGSVAIDLRSPDGSLLSELTPITALDERRFRADLTIPDETFLVETTGVSAAGNPFVRQVSLPAVPQTVALEVEPPGLTAPPDTPTEFTLRIRNAGSVDATFRLLADADEPWGLFGPGAIMVPAVGTDDTPLTVTVPAGGTAEVPITLIVPASTFEGTTNGMRLFAEDLASPQVRNSVSFIVIAGSAAILPPTDTRPVPIFSRTAFGLTAILLWVCVWQSMRRHQRRAGTNTGSGRPNR